jgi:hypothetical protein
VIPSAAAQIVLWSCRVVLAGVFLSAAIAKARRPGALREYVRPVFGALSPLAATCVLAGEAALAVLMFAWQGPATGYAAAGALAAFTLFYAGRLLVSDGAKCACWGGAGGTPDVRPLREAIFGPVLLALRNGFLIGLAALIAVVPRPGGVALARLIVAELGAIAGAEAIVAVGLAASIGWKMRLLRMDPQRHPTTTLYAPRWVRVRGCSTFDLNEQQEMAHS